MKYTKSLSLAFLVALALIFGLVHPASADNIPVTGPNLESAQPANASVVSLASFASSVAVSGNPNLVAGIFARGIFAAPIVQQPSSAPGFVSTNSEAATQFGMAAQYGTIALLAHNYLLGEQFFSVQNGKILSLVYGDGHALTYRVKQVLKFQALTPSSPYSNFVDLDDPNVGQITATDLFYRVYTNDGTLVLQTCIEAEGNSSWGRLFVIAEPAHLVTTLQPNRLVMANTLAIR
jgi:hypothetical protein